MYLEHKRWFQVTCGALGFLVSGAFAWLAYADSSSQRVLGNGIAMLFVWSGLGLGRAFELLLPLLFDRNTRAASKARDRVP